MRGDSSTARRSSAKVGEAVGKGREAVGKGRGSSVDEHDIVVGFVVVDFVVTTFDRTLNFDFDDFNFDLGFFPFFPVLIHLG